MPDLRASIVIPTHDRPALLPRAVRSALAQTVDGMEVLVVDDASRLPAAEVLAPLADPRLRVVRNDGPRGAAGARNCGARHARGEILIFLDDDDEFEPGYPGRVLAAVADGSPAAYGYAAIHALPPGGGAQRLGPRLPTGPVPARAPLRRHLAATSAGFWVRRAVFLDLGGFDPAQRVDEDTDLCVRLVVAGHVAHYEASPGTRVHLDHSAADAAAAQLTRATPPALAASCYLRSFEASAAAFPLWSEARWYLARRYLRRALAAGQVAEARAFAARPEHGSAGLRLRLYLWLKRLVLQLRRVQDTLRVSRLNSQRRQ